MNKKKVFANFVLIYIAISYGYILIRNFVVSTGSYNIITRAFSKPADLFASYKQVFIQENFSRLIGNTLFLSFATFLVTLLIGYILVTAICKTKNKIFKYTTFAIVDFLAFTSYVWYKAIYTEVWKINDGTGVFILFASLAGLATFVIPGVLILQKDFSYKKMNLFVIFYTAFMLITCLVLSTDLCVLLRLPLKENIVNYNLSCLMYQEGTLKVGFSYCASLFIIKCVLSIFFCIIAFFIIKWLMKKELKFFVDKKDCITIIWILVATLILNDIFCNVMLIVNSREPWTLTSILIRDISLIVSALFILMISYSLQVKQKNLFIGIFIILMAALPMKYLNIPYFEFITRFLIYPHHLFFGIILFCISKNKEQQTFFSYSKEFLPYAILFALIY